MDNRGFTLVELLVGLVAATGLLLGISGLYVYSQRVSDSSSSQAFLQRQGSIVMEKMAEQIRPASALTRGTCNADANSIGVTNSSPQSPFCFYKSGSQLRMGTSGGTWNLLSGTATSLTVTSFTTTGTNPASCGASCLSVTISFQLSDPGIRGNSMTFTTDLTRRN